MQTVPEKQAQLSTRQPLCFLQVLLLLNIEIKHSIIDLRPFCQLSKHYTPVFFGAWKGFKNHAHATNRAFQLGSIY